MASRHITISDGELVVPRDADFVTLRSLNVELKNYWVDGIRYTGRTHKIEGRDFYEVDL